MKFSDEFKDRELILKASEVLRAFKRRVNLMEVCGTHTMSIFRSGLKELLPDNINLLSGPGCPVCVTDDADIDAMIALADVPGAVLTTFGDMMRVPGSGGTLNDRKASGADIRVVYSPLDALRFAEEMRDRPVIFLGVGFETTAPTVAATMIEAHGKGIRNFYVYSAHKLVPPAIRAVLRPGGARIDGFILPGHVSAIIGTKPYAFIIKEFGIPSVVSGFEPLDIISSIRDLAGMIERGGRLEVGNEYSRVVRPEGNLIAKRTMAEVFEVADVGWRGFGLIEGSGLEIKRKYLRMNARRVFGAKPVGRRRPAVSCICGDVLRGLKKPVDCKLFGSSCTPDGPKGPCMVSTEGACAAYYKYEGQAARDK